MPNKLAHFAIEADDTERAQKFYSSVFGWQFEDWGPPDFFLIQGAGVHGALQKRVEPLAKGKRGFDCTFAVHDIGKSMQAIEANGGEILESVYTIPSVGQLVKFADTEGNHVFVMQYEVEQLKTLGL